MGFGLGREFIVRCHGRRFRTWGFDHGCGDIKSLVNLGFLDVFCSYTSGILTVGSRGTGRRDTGSSIPFRCDSELLTSPLVTGVRGLVEVSESFRVAFSHLSRYGILSLFSFFCFALSSPEPE